jgi:type 1 glutamine amidotransferase
MKQLALALCFSVTALSLSATEISPLKIEDNPSDSKNPKVVLIVGSNYYKAGEHDYVAAARVFADLLKQSKIDPVIALDWPKKPETLKDAKAVVFLSDGAEKHALVKGNRLGEIQALADNGAGLVFLHQTLDISKDLGDRFRALSGAAWEKNFSQRAHWISTFEQFPKHPISNGVKSFKIDDGWLYKLRFDKDLSKVTPLLRTSSPKATSKPGPTEDVVAWGFERANKGRTFCFTGTHLHASFAEEGYRKFLINGILWAAQQEVPDAGAPVVFNAETLPKYLTPAPKK